MNHGDESWGQALDPSLGQRSCPRDSLANKSLESLATVLYTLLIGILLNDNSAMLVRV